MYRRLYYFTSTAIGGKWKKESFGLRIILKYILYYFFLNNLTIEIDVSNADNGSEFCSNRFDVSIKIEVKIKADIDMDSLYVCNVPMMSSLQKWDEIENQVQLKLSQ